MVALQVFFEVLDAPLTLCPQPTASPPALIATTLALEEFLKKSPDHLRPGGQVRLIATALV